MESEWLSEVPEDFPQEWNVLAIPKGQRCVVVAGEGMTKQYSKSGKLLAQFPSCLPGGHMKQYTKQFTVLDCIYNYDSGKFG